MVIPAVIAMLGATRHLQRGFSLISDRLDLFADLFSAGRDFQPSEPHGVPCCGGLCFRTPELMYLTNGYSVIKEH